MPKHSDSSSLKASYDAVGGWYFGGGDFFTHDMIVASSAIDESPEKEPVGGGDEAVEEKPEEEPIESAELINRSRPGIGISL
jgi:hypothetical protein